MGHWRRTVPNGQQCGTVPKQAQRRYIQETGEPVGVTRQKNETKPMIVKKEREREREKGKKGEIKNI